MPTVLVRSVQYDTGWHAVISPVRPKDRTGGARPVPVDRDGLIQRVRVPAGAHLVTFVYSSDLADLGFEVSAVSWVLVICLALWPGVRRRMARRRSPPSAS
jgi:hypothetical protein